LFCKVIQHARYWPLLARFPVEVGERIAAVYPWRQELELWDPAFSATMPPGIRPPALYQVADLGGDRLALWMEDVQCSAQPWDLPRYGAAAYSLGRWNQRATDSALLAATGRPPHFAHTMFLQNTLPVRGFAPLADDHIWEHPWLRAHADVRRILTVLAPQLGELVERLDVMPLCRPHGDPSPQNLLVPVGEPNTLVAIDVSQQAPTALGCELGQLAVGLLHAGALPSGMLPQIVQTILPAYVAGLRRDGYEGEAATVERAMWTSLLVRSGFDSIPYELLDAQQPDRERQFAARVELTRLIIEGATSVLPLSA
jgi:hypothetical protein